MNVQIFAGWNPEDFTLSDQILITLAFLIFILVITLPGMIIIKSSIKKKIIAVDTSGKANAPLSSSNHDINYKLLLLGIFVFIAPFLYFRFDTNIEDFKETLFFDGSLYSLDNEELKKIDLEKKLGEVQLNVESINTISDSKYSLTKEYESCTRITSPQIGCFKFNNEIYGDIYVDNEDNIDGGIKKYGTLIFQNDGSTIRIITPWYNSSSCMDDSDKKYPDDKYADCYWDKYGLIINSVRKDSKIIRAFQAW